MKTLYLDCSMGAAGDMITGALLELSKEPKVSIERINGLNIPDVKVEAVADVKCGITGTHINVFVGEQEEESVDYHEHHHHHHDDDDHGHHHHHHDDGDHGHHHHHHDDDDHGHHHHHHEHNDMHAIAHLVDNLNVSDKVKNDIKAIYRIIAEAESKVHNITVDEIHFHEVGTKDALADIAAVCLLMEEIAPDRIIASPVCTGFGHVHCAHGVLPVPAPATAEILKGIAVYSGDIEAELCTPTGAALLKYFVDEFGHAPVMSMEKIGYGMGKKEFVKANCVRAIIGQDSSSKDDIVELSCNIDDMTAEEIAFATERLMDTAAVDVFTIPIGMKKSRPATMINVLCHENDKEEVAKKIFEYTSTLGIREKICHRYVLNRTIEEVDTPLGKIRKKVSVGYGVEKEKYEYDDVVRVYDKQ